MNQYALIKYRKDIDGLRGIAIIAVILYHAFPDLAKGGFVGVDIFFVISGYVIGSLLLKNFEAQNFCLYSFYVRRIKRIFPALICVLLFCLIVGWLYLFDSEYLLLSKHGLGSILFYTNFILAKEGGYFAVSSHVKPLMHLWSLAVEEQFYIFCPLMLYFAYKRRFSILFLCVLAIAISVFASIKAMHTSPVLAFYSPLYRGWELLSGTLLAYFAHAKMQKDPVFIYKYKKHFISRSKIVAEVIALSGFVINIGAIFFLKKTQSFPGYYALLPVIGTVCIIAAGEKSFINTHILSHKFFVSIGLIGYPLYLWHWTLLSFLFIFKGVFVSNQLKIAAILISVILSWVTYRCIENPIRSSQDTKLIPFVLAILMGVLGICFYQVVANKGYSERAFADKISSLPQNDERFFNLGIDCHLTYIPMRKQELQDPHCVINSLRPKYLIFGDSHALSFAYSAAINKILDVVMVTHTANPAILFDYITLAKEVHNRDKRIQQFDATKLAIEFILNRYRTIEVVVLISRGPVYLLTKGFGIETQNNPELTTIEFEPINKDAPSISASQAFVDNYVKTIRFMQQQDKKVIFVIDFPELGVDPTLCTKRLFNNTESCVLKRSVVDARQKEYRELVQQIKNAVPDLIIYDAKEAFCDQDYCYGKKDVVYYGDDDHLNLAGSTLLMNDFISFLKRNQLVE